MLKGYRKRFVLFNMLLVGAVLVISLVVQGTYLYRRSYDEMKNTMRMIVEPWDRLGGRLPMLDDGPPPAPPDLREDELPDLPRHDDENMVTLLCDTRTGSITVVSRAATPEGVNLAELVQEVVDRTEPFGYLRAYGMFYYQESNAGYCKIALAESSFLTNRVLRSVLVLFAVYAAAMVLILFISIRLSRLAAKPMEDAIAQERRFVADLSHDLKTPITVILANNSILRNSAALSPAEQAQWLDSTDTAAKNMMSLVGEMLTLSALESERQTLKKVPVNLTSAVEKAELQMESLAYERSITLESDIEEGVLINGTADYAERICNSLLENALKYEPDGGRVSISLGRERRTAVLAVRNSGSVIAPEDLAHIFERFYRGDKARNIRTGHGLGLPILKEMAEAMDAEISVQSTEESGTVFTLRFPPATQM
ncbi:MAG: HAMP domain-containing histidine kinase [Oscillospiraceae bacterium]|nr:HAMP domain-containing histidine kinase [Oscillospiraceae bacterium]